MPNDLPLDEFDATLAAQSRKRLPTIDDLKRSAVAKGINPAFASAIFSQESGGDWDSASSPKGAVGGMQVMPGTFRAMMGDKGDPKDPWDNMEAGLRYVQYGQKKLGTDDPQLLAAGYHQGYDRPELQSGEIADTNDGLISTRDYARKIAARMGIRLDADGNQNPSQKLLKSWADDGLSIGEPILGTAAPAEATKTAAKDDKGWWSRNADYLVDDLKIGWNTLANAFDGWQAAQYSELFEANRAKYGDAPADPTVVENQTGLKAEYDRHMANVARRSAENQQISQRGRPETQQFFQAAEGKDFLEQASILGDALVKNPVGVIADLGIQSAPASLAMIATAVAARFGFRGPAPAVAAGGATSSAVEFGNDYADLRAQGKPHEEAWTAASIKSGVVGLFDAASMGSAGKALDKVLNAGFKGKLKEIGKEVGKQAALGASGEAFGTLASGRTPDLPSVAAEAVGEVFGAPGEAWTTFRGKRDAPPSATGGALPAADVLGDLTPNAPAPAAPGTTGAPAATAPTAPAPGNEAAKAALMATPAAPDALSRVDAIDQRLGTLNSLSATGQITPEAQAEQQALQQERTGLTANWPVMKLGTATAFSTEAGVDLQGQYALVDADALVSSHDENLRMNPAFPQQIQPRDRERAASELQVAGIVQKLNPARLGESADVANGAPIVGADGVVESGNARTIALKRVYQANGETANRYRNWLAENAQRFGFTPEDVAGLGKPVLVRVRRTPVDRAEFARQANAPTTATMSPSEQAKADAARIQSFDDFAPTDSGDFWTAENRDFLRRFVGSLPGTEQAALLGADGQLNQAGYTRVRNAVLARAYGDSPVLLRMVESMDNNLRNVTGALLRVAPRVAKARESIASGAMFDADLTDNVIAAVEELSRLRSEGQSVAEFLAQSGMFGDRLSEETAEILSFLDENIRSPKKIGDFIVNYLDALAAAGNPAQAGLFGASQAPAKSDILKAAKERTGEQGAGAVSEGKGDGAAALATGTAGRGSKGEAQGPGNARSGATARGEPGGTQRPPDGNRQDEVTDTAPSKEGVVVSGDRIVIDGEEHDAKGDNFGQPVPPRALADDDPLLTPTASINTPERKALRDRIVDSFFEGKKAPTDRKPVLYLMGGGGGSGKGTIKKRLVALGLVDVDGAVDLDPDEIKTEHIPEYGRIVQAGDSRAAATTHEESSDLAKRVQARALKGGFDLVLDSTLGNAEKGMKIIADAKAAGYRVVLYGVTVDPRAAVVRASKRAKKSWRYVPVADLLKAHKGFANAFSDYLDAVDVGLIFDNSGTEPVVVAKKSADSQSAEIVNKEAYDRSRGYGELDETARSLGELLRPSRRDDGGQRGVGESQGGAGSRTDRAGQEEPGQERQAGPGGVPLERLSPDEEFQAALSDLGDWVRNNLTGGTVLKMFDEDMEANLAGILARLFTAALRLGHAKYEKARDYVLKQLKANPSTKVLSNKFTDAALRQAFMQAGGSDGNPVPGDGRQGAAGPGAGTAPKPQAARTPGRVRAGSGGPDLFGSDGGVDAGPKGEEPGRAPADGKGPGPQHGPRGGGGKGSGRPPRVPERRPANIKTGRNWRAADTDLTYEGSWLQKAKQNVDALRLLKTLEKEKRQASAEEQKVLAKYIGWGASDIRNQIFAPGAEYRLTGAWRELWRELKDTLTAEEWAEASRSTQYAHYTSKGVVRGMWRAMQRLGFAGGNIIEPGAGIGVFAGMMPGDVSAASTYTGIEFEPIAGAILKQLQPDELIRVESYVDSTLPENFYDVAIGNPPFHNTPILADPKYRKNRFALHDYFFAKTLDRVKPGGLMVFVTSRYTMDKAGDKARTWLAERADLVGAIRLPQTAFLKNAGTEVVTDVIFLRKKIAGQQWSHAQDWLALKPVKAGQGEESVNQYFADHPDMVLGTHAQSGTMYSANEYTVLPPEGDIEALFDAAVDRLPANVFDPAGAGSTSQTKANYIDWNPKAEKENSFYVDATGVLMQRRQGVGHPVPIRTGKDGKGLFPKHAQILRDYIPLRDALKQAQYDQLTDGPWEQSLKALRRAYDTFTAKHGRVNQFTTVEVEETVEDENGVRTKVKAERYRYPLLNVINDDPEWTLVMALETVNEEKGEIKDGHFLTDRVLAPPKPADIRTPGDALLASLNDYGRVNIDAMADRLGVEPDQVIEALGPSIYEEPSGKWITSDEYLSGDVVTKLEEAKAAAGNDKRFDRNVAALNDVQPAAITSDRITAPLGANWIPPDVYEAFAKEKLAIRGVKITYERSVNFWSVAATADGFSEFGTHRVGASEILNGVLNARPLEVWDTLRFPDGSTKRQLNKAETEAANLKRTEMRAAFASWAWTDEKRTARLQDIYNSIYNRVVPRKFDGRHLSLPGTSLKWKVHPHVRTGAWRIVQQGNTYLAHAVGSGKTFTSIISAVEQKRLGLISKPMFVVPNHMLSQFSREFLDLYPAANIMVADEREFHTDRRRAFVARAALSNVDGIIITHSAFGLLDLDADFKTAFVNEQLEEMRAALMAVAGRDKLETNRKGQTVKSRDPTIRQIEGMIEKLEQRLESMTKVEGKDQNARFDEMGVDFLYVDEAHLFRKLDYHTARRVKGIDPNGSQRAFDLYMKTRWLEEKHPGRSLAMMSGTPITNTMAELYTVQRYLDPETLRKKKLDKFDAWANTFGAERTELEQDAGGNYVPVTRFGKFENVPELVSMFREFADVLTSTQLAALLPDTRPKVAGGTRSAVITPLTAPYREIRAQLRDRMETSKNWKPSFQEPNNPDPVIAIIGDGKLAAIDHRFLDPTADSDPDSKLNRMIDSLIRIHKETADMEFRDKAGKVEPLRGATQMVFADVGFGEGVAARRGFSARAWLMKRMTEAGIPREQIAFMSDYKKASEKLKLYQAMNTGKVRVLIGSSANMGTGVNAQQRLLALHHLDSPWYPADLEQREGRIVRQGNKNPVVQIYAYSMKGSYDETMWTMLARKQHFIEQALSGDVSVRSVEDVSEESNMAQIAAMTSGDPRTLKLAGLKAEIERLYRLWQAHENQQARLRSDKAAFEHRLGFMQRDLPNHEQVAEKVTDISGDAFAMRVGDTTFTKRKEAGQALVDRFRALFEQFHEGSETVGAVSGFPLEYQGYKQKRGDNVYYESVIRLMAGPTRPIVMSGLDADPVGVAMSLQYRLAEIERLPADMKAEIGELRAKIADVESRIGAKFQFSQELASKQKERDELETDMTTHPSVQDGSPPGSPPQPKLSRQSPAPAGLSVSAVEGAISPVLARAKRLPAQGIRVVQSISDLPRNLRNFLTSANAESEVEGIYDPATKSVWLVADHLRTALRAEQVLFHELFGHFGLKGLFGNRMDAALRDLVARNANLRKRAATMRKEFGYGEALANEEAVVELAERGERMEGFHRFVTAIEKVLRDLGFTRLADWIEGLTDAEAMTVLAEARRFVRGERDQEHQAEPSVPKMSRAASAGVQQADAILSKQRTRFTPLETLTRLAVRATFLDRITSAGYDRLLRLLNQITPERVKAGVVSDYGVPEAVIDRRIEMQGTVKRGFRETAEIIAALGNLTRAESRVAYQWMNADDPASSDYFMDQLPADSVKVLAEVEKWIDKLSEEAVQLGLMTPEVRDRHRFAYLRRSYLKHEEEASAQEKTKRRRAIAVLGDQFKGRGMVDGVEMTRIENAAPTWWKRKLQGQKADKALRGEEFIRLERLSGTAQASTPLPGMTPGQQKRKVLEVVYWPAAEAIPSKYSAWDYAGRWQVRDVKGSQAVMWRDFTAQERERMGEIDEVKYAVARTLHGMVHDVEAARYLKWVADQHSRATAQGITVVDASESLKRAFRPDEWVQVPDSTIAGTGGTKRYGALAGRYLPGPIWNDIRQTVGPNVQPLGEWYGNILRAWKVSKTALSPAVHTNNIMANFVMADWHDVRAAHIAKALEIVVRSKDPAHREIINRFEDAGGSIGTWSLTELQREQLEPLLAQLKAQVSQNGNGLVGAGAAIQLALSGKWKDAIAAASLSKGAVITQKVGKAMIDLYQAEDVVFRLAAFLRAKEEGADDRAAAKVARKSFLDYQINAPWIQLMRQTAFPFIAFTYRAAPMLLETAAKKPWKLAKMAVVLGSLNALGYALSGGDEDDERKLLPEEKAGKIFGFVAPKLIRMPWNDAHGSPVFLDVRRWIPVGDLADMGQTHAAVPILPVAVPAGPLAVFAEIAFNRSQFTGKEITKSTDTGVLRSVAEMDVDRFGLEQEAKVLDHLFKAFAPNIGLIPGTYAFTAVKNAATGRTDAFGREQSVAQAVASGVGVKVGSYPRDVLLLNETRKRDAQVRDIQENITALKREHIRRGITADEYGEKVAKQQEKLKRINEAFKEKVAQ